MTFLEAASVPAEEAARLAWRTGICYAQPETPTAKGIPNEQSTHLGEEVPYKDSGPMLPERSGLSRATGIYCLAMLYLNERANLPNQGRYTLMILVRASPELVERLVISKRPRAATDDRAAESGDQQSMLGLPDRRPTFPTIAIIA